MLTKHPHQQSRTVTKLLLPQQRRTATKHLRSIKLLQRRKLLNQQLLPRITRNLNLTKPQVPQPLPKTTRNLNLTKPQVPQPLPKTTRNLNLTKPQVPQPLLKTTRKPQLLLKITKLPQPIKLRMLRLKSNSKQTARYLLNQLNILMNNSRNCLTISRLSSKPSKQRETNRVNSKSHQRRQ